MQGFAPGSCVDCSFLATHSDGRSGKQEGVATLLRASEYSTSNLAARQLARRYFYGAEERQRMLLPKKPKLREIWRLLRHGEAITEDSGAHREVTAK